MELQIGVQTIIWGEDFEGGLEKTLQQIKLLGFRGVEFAQVPSKLGDPESFEKTFLKFPELTLLGFAGGSLEKRLEFCKGLKKLRPLYLYLQKWDDQFAPVAIESGYTLAFHPHQYSPIDRFAMALGERDKHPGPQFKFLPDTAHLFLANEDFLEILTKHATDSIAIHIKDWTPQYGWSIFTYARGFTELGRGIVPLREAWRRIQKSYKGWVVVEQDSTALDPATSLEISKQWLDGFRPSRLERIAHPIPCPPPTIRKLPSTRPDIMVEALGQMSQDSLRGLERLYSSILEGFSKLCDCKCATLWEVSPRNESLTLQAFWQPQHRGRRAKPFPKITTLKIPASLSGEAVTEQTIRTFKNIRDRRGNRWFQDEEYINNFKLEGMISIQVPNLSNINQPELLINLFPNRADTIVADGDSSKIHPPELESEFKSLARYLVVSVEQAWEEMRASVAKEISWGIGKIESVQDLLNKVLDTIQFHVCSKHASIFLVHPAETLLELRATTYSEGEKPFLDLYTKDSPTLLAQLPGYVWQNRSVFNSRTDAMPAGAQSTGSDLLMPIFKLGPPLGEVMGVIWCSGKIHEEGALTSEFSVSDEIVLDAIQAAMVPHLDRMQAAEWRGKALARITHELRGPIGFTKGAIERMKEGSQKRDVEMKTARADLIRLANELRDPYGTNWAAAERMRGKLQEIDWNLPEDYLDDMDGYMDVMNQVMEKTNFLKPVGGIQLERDDRVKLMQDIIAPAVDYARTLLKKKGISPRNAINYDIPEDMPAMFLDKARFQQVIFNLLTNAIKYSQKKPNTHKVDPEKFHVSIIGVREASGRCKLIFQDKGIGIAPGMEESIFKEGVRGPDAHKHDVTGDGLGLWMVREILHAHAASGARATIKLTSRENPTEFTIFLPAALQIPEFHTEK